jgi:hypothetical protein
MYFSNLRVTVAFDEILIGVNIYTNIRRWDYSISLL